MEDMKRESKEDGYPHFYENIGFSQQSSSQGDLEGVYEEIQLDEIGMPPLLEFIFLIVIGGGVNLDTSKIL